MKVQMYWEDTMILTYDLMTKLQVVLLFFADVTEYHRWGTL